MSKMPNFTTKDRKYKISAVTFLALNSSAGLEEQRTFIYKYIQWLKRHQFQYQIYRVTEKKNHIPFKYGVAK